MAFARFAYLTVTILAVGSFAAWRIAAAHDNAPRPTRDQLVDRLPAHVETATFGAGCFWHVEAAFRKLPGVVATAVGFAGGTAENPTYKQVTAGATGHVEVVRVTFDPAVISYDQLLETFWSCHDPTRPRDPDERAGGEPHRSIIFVSDDVQRSAAEASRIAQAASHPRPITTEIRPAATFWRAESYHQQYLEKTGHTCPPR
jgi:peptide-methionine (S)-S-oxide reductase